MKSMYSDSLIRLSSSVMSAGFILKNQPPSSGSSLTSAGLSASASLTSTISPSSGARMSEAALTLSMTTISSPFDTVVPGSGRSTKTMSPSWVAACSVMPTTISSPSGFSHSCSSVYFIGKLSVCRLRDGREAGRR